MKLDLMNHQLVMLRFTFESVSLKPSFMKSSKNLPTLKFISTHESIDIRFTRSKSTHLLLSNWESYSNPDAKDKFCLYHNAAKSSLEVVVKEKSFATQNPTLRYFKLAKLPTFQVLF